MTIWQRLGAWSIVHAWNVLTVVFWLPFVILSNEMCTLALEVVIASCWHYDGWLHRVWEVLFILDMSELFNQSIYEEVTCLIVFCLLFCFHLPLHLWVDWNKSSSPQSIQNTSAHQNIHKGPCWLCEKPHSQMNPPPLSSWIFHSQSTVNVFSFFILILAWESLSCICEDRRYSS